MKIFEFQYEFHKHAFIQGITIYHTNKHGERILL